MAVIPVNSSAAKLNGRISSDTTIDADTEITGDTVVEKGVTLTVKKGVNITFTKGALEVYGVIRAEGTKEAPINLAGTKERWCKVNGVSIINSKEEQSLISHCNFSGLNTAVTVINSSAVIENSSFSENKIAIDAKQKDETLIKNNVIKSCKKVGIFCKSDSKAIISGNEISGIKKFGIYIYRSGSVKVTRNKISSCGKGIMVAYVDSDPEISENRLSSNKEGILVEKGANPMISLNVISDNEFGISVTKRSDPLIMNNDITKNKKGLFITYSSYPTIKKNNIIDNEYSVYLEYQSAEWEKKRGDSVKRGGKKMTEKQQGMGAFSGDEASVEFVTPKKTSDDKISAFNNYWGEDITKEMEGGASNISVIYDYFDAMDFIEEGVKYKLDSVDYSSWSKTRFEHK
jgi:parallel beta-helix repeat protein